METYDGGGRPPELNLSIEFNADRRDFVPSPAEFVSIASDSSDVVEPNQHGDGSFSTVKRKKSCKKHKYNKEKKHSQDSVIPLGQTICPSSKSITDSQITDCQMTDSLASPSATISQTPSIPVYTPSGRQVYKSSDKGPFTVHVQKVEPSPTSGTFLHPINFGHFLSKNKIQNIVEGSVSRIGRNRVSLSFSDANSANIFIANEILLKMTLRHLSHHLAQSDWVLSRGSPLNGLKKRYWRTFVSLLMAAP